VQDFIKAAPKFIFFTGKGGVGKTSMACATAVGLAGLGRQVLLISTDPASNLDEVLGCPLDSRPLPVTGAAGLHAMNINPMQAAAEYRERMVGPYRGVLPDASIQQMEEQLSGACTVEIAGFNEFSKFIGDEQTVAGYDHIVLDTAPTGHTLRLLNLPAAWTDFIADNKTGSSCLGPLAGLAEQQKLFAKVIAALKNPAMTRLAMVARADAMSLKEAARAAAELHEQGMVNQCLIVNGVFLKASDDPIATAFADLTRTMLERIPASLKKLPRYQVPFRAAGIMGMEALRRVSRDEAEAAPETASVKPVMLPPLNDWERFFDDLAAPGKGVILTMGKGGVGKTTMAALIALELAQRGHAVLLSTTDPAAHIAETLGEAHANIEVARIDPRTETAQYVENVLAKNRGILSAQDMELLEEEMRSPCIEEIAVFQAFANTVDRGTGQFIVLDTAPTGHTLLLLDSTQAYHREVSRSSEDLPEAVKELLPRIRDPKFTRMLIVTLPEATPVHEAAALQADLKRAGITPYGWIINRSFAATGTRDPVLVAKGQHELAYIEEVCRDLSKHTVLAPWIGEELVGEANLGKLKQGRPTTRGSRRK
jgi:arsenite-transporting ATPase